MAQIEPDEQRILRQHVETDRLLGVEAVPVGDPPAIAASPLDSPPPAAIQSGPPLNRTKRIELLKLMDENEVQQCTKCELCNSRTNTVFGEGDPEANLMFIGEGPGQTEDETGRPFVGRAGDMLTKQITAIGLEREQVFIANVVKCRPPNNRVPSPAEAEACWEYLQRQIGIIRPKVIVTLGGPAMQRLLHLKEGITRVRGTWHEITVPGAGVIPVLPTFHPAYLLRAYTKENRAKVWSDLKAAKAKVEQ